jgi:uncharacterized protein YbjT (DUF2867 family)
MKIAVAGATGRVGSHVVDVLESAGHEVVPISRSNGVDVITREGLADALSGVEAVIDAATGPSPDGQEATEFFTTAAHNLGQLGSQAGVQRIVVVSIIGCDKFDGGYGGAKVAHEEALRAGPIPASVLRASQFHEFVEQLLQWGRQGDVSYVPEMRTQPVAARSVAQALADLAVAPEATGSSYAEIAGPREESLVELAKLLVARRGDSVKVEGQRDPSDPATEVYLNGSLLPGPGATLAGPTFEEWLGG